MQSRFEQQEPLNNSGFVHSDALEQHVGKRVKGAKAGRKSGQTRGDQTEHRARPAPED